MRSSLTPHRRAILAALAGAPALARAQGMGEGNLFAPSFAFTFASGRDSTGWLPLDPGEGLTLSARLNGRPVRLVLDSGASVSLVDLRLAQSLGLRAKAQRTVRDGAGLSSSGADLADVVFDLDGLRLTGAHTVGVDLSGLADAGQDTPVVLGREVFEHLMVDIDPPRRRVAFHAPGAYAPPAGARALALVPAGKAQRRLMVSVEGDEAIPAQFDLGSQSALVASEAYARAHGWMADRPTSTWIAATVAGIRPERTATVRGFAIAGAALPPAPLETVATWDAPDLPVIVGLPSLSRFRLTTDYPQDRLWLTPDAAALAKPFRKNRSGLACKPAGAALEVVHVAQGSPADVGEWRVGDRIVAVDARPAWADRGFGDGPAGRRCRLTLADGSVRTLILSDYF